MQLMAFTIQGKKMQNIFPGSALALILAPAAPFAPAQDLAPDVLLKAVTSEVIAIIRQDTFAGRVRDSGIEGLIKSLSDKNRQDGYKT